MKGKVETVTVDRVKPAHFEREPESGNTTQRQTNPKPKSMTSKPAAISRKPQKDRARSSSTTNSKSFRTGVDTNMSTQTRCSTHEICTSSAIALQSDVTRARLPRPPTLYKPPYFRTTIVSRPNGDSGSFRTYSRIPLHL